jgi:hypothetical protein
VFRVSDNRCGSRTENLPHVFDRFLAGGQSMQVVWVRDSDVRSRKESMEGSSEGASGSRAPWAVAVHSSLRFPCRKRQRGNEALVPQTARRERDSDPVGYVRGDRSW